MFKKIIGSLENIFGRSFLIVALFPSAIIAMLTLAVVYNLVPSQSSIHNWINSLREFNFIPTTIFVVLIIIIAQLLSSYRLFFVRIFEGYWGSIFKSFRKRLLDKQLERFKKLEKALSEKQKKFINLRQSGENHERLYILRMEIDELSAQKAQLFPTKEEDVVATSLGNVIRSAEVYPYNRYNIDSITIWIRMQDVISSVYKHLLNTSRDSLDFLIIMSSISIIFGLECCLAFLISSLPRIVLTNWIFFLIFGVLSFPVAWVFYKGALNSAISYAEAIKSCFDLFRRKLLKQLSIVCPKTLEEEHQLWEELSLFISYGIQLEKIGSKHSKIKFKD
ncbi:hypothetical protein KAW65_00070 [candidate division WOR-3 bacterium]|nr:hypothetical protein [candidate division WOR-3 bacterium]